MERGIESPLVILAKLPFPQFVTNYYKLCPNSRIEASDPTVGYKMFTLPPIHFEICHRYLKEKNGSVTYFIGNGGMGFRNNALYQIQDILEMPFDTFVKSSFPKHQKIDAQKNLIYIMQYITQEEAERLGLESFTFKTPNGYRGFDLEGKLDCFNEGAREVLYRYLGLNGYKRMTIDDISNDLGISAIYLNPFFKLVIPALTKTKGELINLLKIVPSTLEPGKIREYYNYEYKKLDLNIQTKYVAGQIESETERKLLETLTSTEQQIYIVRKYMFDDSESVTRYCYVPKSISATGRKIKY